MHFLLTVVWYHPVAGPVAVAFGRVWVDVVSLDVARAVAKLLLKKQSVSKGASASETMRHNIPCFEDLASLLVPCTRRARLSLDCSLNDEGGRSMAFLAPWRLGLVEV